jgi:hypothetical protein
MHPSRSVCWSRSSSLLGVVAAGIMCGAPAALAHDEHAGTVMPAEGTPTDATGTDATIAADVVDTAASPAPATASLDQAQAGPTPSKKAGPTAVIAVPASDERGSTALTAEGVVAEDPAAPLPAGPPPAPANAPGAHAPGVTFSGIPAVNYIADNGLGLGVIAAAYFHDGVTAPYRTAITLQLFSSTKLVQDHNVIIDSLRLFDLPLRLNARLGYLSSLTQNYCGVGGTLPCDPAIAERAARDAGLDEGTTAFDDFARRYYQRRFMNPYGLVNLRYALIERSPGQPTRVEVTGGYRAFYFIPGDVFADEDGDGQPDLVDYPGSLYARDFPEGEAGLSSVVTAGLMLDSRDAEPSPTSGWWNELSVRTTTPGLSTWTFGGFNVTVRGFTPLPVSLPFYGDTGRRLVLANRLTFDGVVGDPPVQELARLGGSQDIYAFGGVDIGRGIRVQRFLGKGKILNQSEIRFRFAEAELFAQQFAFTLAGFVDAGIVADELFAPSNVGVSAGGGGALRIAWNENFVIRIDLGVSPLEQWALQPYVTINQPF